MRSLKLLFIIFTVLFIVIPAPSRAQNTQDFRITDFVQEFKLNKNDAAVATAVIDEYITAEFPSYNQNHGILRALPLEYSGTRLRTTIIAVDKQQSGADASAAIWNYSTYTENNNIVLKIGDADTFVHGTTHYHIRYSIQDFIRFYGAQDELFININGTQWPQTIERITSKIYVPGTFGSDAIQKQVCFTGRQASTEYNCSITTKTNVNGDTVVTTVANAPLLAYENMSVGVGFTKGIFAEYQPSFWEKYGWYFILLVPLLMPVTVFILMIRRWRAIGKDPKDTRAVVAQYEPLPGVDVLMSSALLHQKIQTVAFTATVIDLAIRGYICIEDTNSKVDKKPRMSDFSLRKNKEYGDLVDYEKSIMSALFTKGDVVTLASLRSTFASYFKSVSKKVDASIVNAGLYTASPQKRIARYVGIGTGLIVLGFIIIVQPLYIFIGAGISTIVSGVIVMLFARIMPAKTQKGIQAKNHIEGLRLYIAMAEQDRIRFHKSVESAQRIQLTDNRAMVKLYEALLPFAILFGMEESWSKQFKDIYTEQPSWYNSQNHIFTTMYLANAMHGFAQASVQTFTPPSSSGGSFSGGGGFSGGGAGGGGGGGW